MNDEGCLTVCRRQMTEFSCARKRAVGNRKNKQACSQAKEAKMSHINLLYHIVFGTKERYLFITN